MNISEAIKRCSMDAFEASVPCDVMFGTVVETEPCRVKVGDMIIPDEIFTITDSLLYREVQVSFGIYDRVIVINEGVKAGDILVVLRKKGGGEYIAVGRIG